MTVSPTPLETLLAQAHAQPGEPQTRLSGLLSALEDADWTLLMGGQEALAAQIASLIGPGLIRLDPRLNLNREAFASFGLALASSDGDWKGARAVWLLEPDERALTRARRADVPVIVDATLAPGGRWLEQGVHLVVYRDAVTLTGYDDVQLSSVSGLGSRPRRVASGPADLAVALALRDIGTLALRMNRRTRNAEALLPRFAGRALPVSGGVLLLEHDGPSTVTPLGGNLSAARAVPAGTLVTVGIESPDDAWTVLGAVLNREARPAPAPDEFPMLDEDLPEAPVSRGVSLQSEPGQREPGQRDPGQRAPDGERDRQPDRRPRTEPQERPDRSAPAGDARPNGAVQAEPHAPEAAPEQPAPQDAPAQPQDAAQHDYSDREFVFTPPPVLPPLPALTAPSVPTPVSQPSVPNVPDSLGDMAHDDGRPARGRRGRRGKHDAAPAGTAPLQAQDSQPEIVMSESFTRPPEPETAPEETQDAWPEEALATPAEYTPTPETADPDAHLPLQLPPDLPTDASLDVDGLTPEQQAIFARLREWRNAEAKRQTVSRFIIASNATLAEVARRVPYTEADLKAVKGMGPERLRKYGEKILEVVRG
ncbi:HRDC domain-containing protein [Deinococcus aquiradiocola]|uniref:HRDC domain-containing protein n=1 Tax=Deinococcus aquiradiocola TaxID=393059 RepID=A0A917PI89_9DEIO|nr:HRDC domain-containing protein [Deinococcus aquiradiocola]GGJ80008.1 hypothetical protein GCM10008939_24850 [Deinococcus aquiradiocola]